MPGSFLHPRIHGKSGIKEQQLEAGCSRRLGTAGNLARAQCFSLRRRLLREPVYL